MGNTAHIWMDEKDIVRQNGKYIGEGESLFLSLVSSDFHDCSRVVITYRDQEWDVNPRLQATVLEAVRSTPSHHPSYMQELEREKNKTEAEKRHERMEKEEAERRAYEERMAYVNRPAVDPSLDLSQVVRPRFTTTQRRQGVDTGFNELLKFRKTDPDVLGLSPQQVYLPGEQREKASRYSNRGLAAVKREKTTGKKIAAIIGVLVTLVGLIFVGRMLQTQNYAEVCFDTRTLFVVDAEQCLDRTEYAGRAWVLSEDMKKQTIGEPLVSALMENPKGNVSITTLENAQKETSSNKR